jgi:hypothetical protein
VIVRVSMGTILVSPEALGIDGVVAGCKPLQRRR